jgi:hypothetical protein
MITLKFNEHAIPECEPSPESVPCWFTLYEAGEWIHISRFNPELGFHSLQFEHGDVYDAYLKWRGYSPWRKVEPLGNPFKTPA